MTMLKNKIFGYIYIYIHLHVLDIKWLSPSIPKQEGVSDQKRMLSRTLEIIFKSQKTRDIDPMLF